MKNITLGFGSLFCVALLGPLFAGCFGDDSEPCEGSLNCACYPNYPGDPGICKTGLACVMNVCVAPDGGSKSPDASMSTPDATMAMPDATSPPPDATQSSDGTTPGDATQSSDAAPPVESGGGGTNVVTNGDFSMGDTCWGTVGGNGTFMVNGTMGCVSVPAGGNATLGWPETNGGCATTGTSIADATSYTLTYTAVSMMGGNVTINAKIGQTMSPYNADFTANDMATGNAQPFSHQFTAMGGDTSAGIAFMIPQTGNVTNATTVCFQNVSLVQN